MTRSYLIDGICLHGGVDEVGDEFPLEILHIRELSENVISKGKAVYLEEELLCTNSEGLLTSSFEILMLNDMIETVHI